MKKYVTPEMKALTFEVEDSISTSASAEQTIYNDSKLQW
jgi:hypothetical protein